MFACARELAGLGRSTWYRAGGLLRGIDRLAQGVVRGAFRFAGERLGPITVVALTAAFILSVCNWGWLQAGVAGPESGSTTIRNLSFLFAGLIGLPLAIWRSLVSERQADAAQRQAEISQQDLLNERYQRGAEKLGSDVLAVRLAGIYALQCLAEEHPQQFHLRIMHLFCAFVRSPSVERTENPSLGKFGTGQAPKNREAESGARPRQDVEAAMEAIARRSKEGIGLERDAEFLLDLRGAQLAGLNLINIKEVNLSWANLSFADLSQINLRPHADMSWIHAVNTNLSNACLVDVNLSVARFWGADLSQTVLAGANVSGAVFSNNRDTPCSLTQAQLDSARADPRHPPIVDGVLDTETDDPLIWKGNPLHVQS